MSDAFQIQSRMQKIMFDSLNDAVDVAEVHGFNTKHPNGQTIVAGLLQVAAAEILQQGLQDITISGSRTESLHVNVNG